MNDQYLSDTHLEGLNNYKYNAKDTSPLSIYIMHPFWNYIVEYLPRGIAPNLMTFVGFLFTVANFVVLSWYDWGFYSSTTNAGTTPIPEWVWLMAAINIFLAYTLDGIDGKQARRIGLSGPLGELFDHGLDSYAAVFIPACLYSIFGRNVGSISPIRMYYVMWMVFFNFYICHWEKYNTGVLYLPWGYDLSMWGSTIMYLISYFYGYQFWKILLPFDITMGHIMEWVLHISALSNLPMVIINVYKSYKYKTGKMRPFSEAARPLVSFILFGSLFMIWAHCSQRNIMENDPRVLFILSGTIFSNISCRLIIAQMSNTRCELFHWMTPIYFISILIALTMPALERIILYCLTIATTFTHWHYGTNVVQQLCRHFHRECFGVVTKKAVE